MDQFRVGEVKDLGAGEEANCYCYFPLFTYINAGHILEVHMLFLSFLLVELVPRVRVCAISF